MEARPTAGARRAGALLLALCACGLLAWSQGPGAGSFLLALQGVRTRSSLPRARPAMLAPGERGRVGRERDLETPAALPPGWSVQTDPASGAQFYVNEAAGVSQWEPPAAVSSGWSVQKDPATGRSYYVNAATGASQWEPPAALAAVAEAAAPVKTEPVAEVMGAAPAAPPVAPRVDLDKWGNPSLRGAPASLAADVERFRKQEQESGKQDGEPTLVSKIINVLGSILTYNFFIIIAFLGWFISGIVGEYGFHSPALLASFRGAWAWLIQPLLTTHMTLTFLSAGLERLPTGEEA